MLENFIWNPENWNFKQNSLNIREKDGVSLKWRQEDMCLSLLLFITDIPFNV